MPAHLSCIVSIHYQIYTFFSNYDVNAFNVIVIVIMIVSLYFQKYPVKFFYSVQYNHYAVLILSRSGVNCAFSPMFYHTLMHIYKVCLCLMQFYCDCRRSTCCTSTRILRIYSFSVVYQAGIVFCVVIIIISVTIKWKLGYYEEIRRMYVFLVERFY